MKKLIKQPVYYFHFMIQNLMLFMSLVKVMDLLGKIIPRLLQNPIILVLSQCEFLSYSGVRLPDGRRLHLVYCAMLYSHEIVIGKTHSILFKSISGC